MEYFFYNTDARALRHEPRPRFRVLIDEGFAACGGNRDKYGEQLRQISEGDLLLMYENRVGVVAVGRAKEQWDGVSHTAPWYYSGRDEMEGLDGGAYEYRIGVNWFLDISDKPIDVKGIRKRFGYKPKWSPRRIIYRIKQRDVVEQIIKELKRAPSAPKAIDLNPPSPERVATTAYRIIRDSALARRVKSQHKHKCQICGHSIELPDGSLYAEAHHIQPLGKPHNGPDVIGNILCVCPNHHAELDLRVRKITLSDLAIVDGHAIARRFVDYHNNKIYGWV